MSAESLVNSLSERLGRVELMLFGSGDSIDRLVTRNAAQVEQLAKLPGQLNDLENRIIAIEQRLDVVEKRIERARTNLHLRELIALVDRVPGGWRSLLAIWIGATAAIDLAIDLLGVTGILQRWFGF